MRYEKVYETQRGPRTKKSRGLMVHAIVVLAMLGICMSALVTRQFKSIIESDTTPTSVVAQEPMVGGGIPAIVMNRYVENKRTFHTTASQSVKDSVMQENIRIRNTYPNINEYYDGKW